MQKYISLFFSVMLFLSACNDQKTPQGVLDEKAMVGVLIDVHLTDGSIYTVPQLPDSMYKYAHDKFAVLFKKHHTTDAVFRNSLRYYSRRPEQMQDIYAQTEAAIKAKLDSLNKPDKPVQPAVRPAVQNNGHAPLQTPAKPSAVPVQGNPSAKTTNPAMFAHPRIYGLLHRPTSQKTTT